MKKFFGLGLVLVLFLGLLTGCSSGEPNDDGDDDPIVEEFVLKLAETVVYEKDGIKITLTGIEEDSLFGPTINVLIENDSTTPILVQSRDFTVNGFIVMPLFSESVEAGKKSNTGLVVSKSDLEELEINYIKDIEFRLSISNDDTWATIDDSKVVKVSTNADTSKLTVRNFVGQTLMDKSGFKIVYIEIDEESILGADAYFYIENNSTADVTIQAEDLSVNGFMITALLSETIPAGKKVYASLSIFSSDLEANKITKINELELKFKIFNANTWKDITNSGSVKVTVE